MTLEERVTDALRAQTESLRPATTDLSAIRSAARVQARTRAAIGVACTLAVILVMVVSGATDIGRDRSDGRPIAPPSPGPNPSAPIDTTSWTTYASDRYDLEVGHPPDWTEVPSTRKWSADTDIDNYLSPALESFVSPLADLRVSVWSAPLASGASIESTGDIEAWVKDYCEASGDTPCTGIHDRAVTLCLEKRDCHPALLVPFRDDVLAFFSGGIYDADAMTIVAVWRGESSDAVWRYGGAERLLRAFLSTMQVGPPFADG